MSQEKTAEIIDLSATRAAAKGDGAGPFLMSARLAAGLEISEVAADTKIKPAHIEAIEKGDASALPATPFAVGFVKVYAGYLGLDADAIAAEFRKEIIAARPQPEPETRADRVPAYEASGGVKLASLLGIILIGAFAVWIAFQIAGNSGEGERALDAPSENRIRVSETRAEAPRPRAPAPTNEYDVLPIPPVGDAAPAAPAAPPAPPAPVAPEAATVTDATGPGATDVGAAGADAVRPMLAPALMGAGAPAPPDGPADVASNDRAGAPDGASSVAGAETPGADDGPIPAPGPTSASRADALMAAQMAPTPGVADDPAAQASTQTVAAPIAPEPALPARSDPAADPVIVDARLVRSIGPDYPQRCERRAAVLETVSVIFDVNVNGRPTNARVTGATNSCFEDAAVAAVSRWRFDPRTENGAPRPQQGLEATLNFRR